MRSRKWLVALAIAFLSAACCQVAPEVSADSSAKSNAVSIPIFVTYKDGRPADNLTEGTLSILDNKKPPQSVIALRSSKEIPLRLGLLIDKSNSQKQSELYRPGAEAASVFIGQVLTGTEDKAFIEPFDTVPNASHFLNKQDIARFKVNLTPSGATAFYDAIQVACNDRMSTDSLQPARRVIVVLSDGGDNQSRTNLDAAIASAQRAMVVVFAISTGDDGRANGRRSVDNSRLKHLADSTGGTAFLHLRPKEMAKVFSEVQELIGSMYVLTYVPADSVAGQYHEIELKATDKNLRVRSPKGYYGTQ